MIETGVYAVFIGSALCTLNLLVGLVVGFVLASRRLGPTIDLAWGELQQAAQVAARGRLGAGEISTAVQAALDALRTSGDPDTIARFLGEICHRSDRLRAELESNLERINRALDLRRRRPVRESDDPLNVASDEPAAPAAGQAGSAASQGPRCDRLSTYEIGQLTCQTPSTGSTREPLPTRPTTCSRRSWTIGFPHRAIINRRAAKRSRPRESPFSLTSGPTSTKPSCCWESKPARLRCW